MHRDFTLYTTGVSPFAARIRILIALKKLNVDVVDPNEIGLEEYLKIIPAGRVPAIILPDGQSLIESEAICEFIEETFTDIPGYPKDPVERARLRLIARRGDIDLAASLSAVGIMQQTGNRDESLISIAREAGKKALTSVETLLSERTPYAMGESLSHADGVLLTVLHMVERMWQLYEIGEPFTGFPYIQAYRKALSRNPIVAEIEGPYLAEVDRVMEMMKTKNPGSG
jgi:glutathione S-transferase